MTTTEDLPPVPGYRALLRASGTIVELRSVGGIAGAIVELASASVGPDGRIQQDPVRVFVELDQITAVLPRAEATP